MFWNTFNQWGENLALKCRTETVTYKDLNDLCNRFAGRLPKQKCLVLIETGNTIPDIVALYGALQKGHAVLLCEENNPGLKMALEKCFHPKYIYEKTGTDWALRADPKREYHPLHDDLAILLTTSGSTGEQKCVRLSHTNIQSNTEAITAYLPIEQQDQCLQLLPICYSYGLSVLNTHLSKGATVHLHGPTAESAGFVSYLIENQISTFPGVPYTYELLELTGFRNHYFPDLKYITQAGGRLRKELVLSFNSWAKKNNSLFFVMYGQTEASPRISYVPPQLLADNPESIGRALPCGSLSLVDSSSNTITEPNVDGELVFVGPNVMLGYAEAYQDLALGQQSETLFTGDLAHFNNSGLFQLTGRKKRFCKLYGKRYNLDRIEQILNNVDATAVCCSDDVTLFIATKNKKDRDLAGLVTEQFGISSANIRVTSFADIPKLTSGKVHYQKLLSSFQADQKTASPVANKTAEKLQQAFESAFPGYGIFKKTDTFQSLGGDSLNYVAISIELEQILGQLPANWEKMTLEELGQQQKNRLALSLQTLETSVVLRGSAIAAIVLQHYDFFFEGGAVLLMLIAGYNFGRFHLLSLLQGEMVRVFKTFTLNILLTYWGVLLVYNIVEFLIYGRTPVTWESFFLISNFFYMEAYQPFPTWFIQVLFHSIILVAMPLSIPAILKFARRKTTSYLITLLGLALVYRVLDQFILVELFPIKHVDQRTAWELWIFLFGMLCYQLKSSKNKLFLSLILLVLTALFWYGFWSRTIILSSLGLLLIHQEQLRIPRMAVQPIKILASASIYIYMLHVTGLAVSVEPFGPVIQVIVGTTQGLIFSSISSKVSRHMLYSRHGTDSS